MLANALLVDFFAVKMLGSLGVMGIITLFWVVFGGVGPWLVPKGHYKGVYQTMIVTTAVCCWLHWFLTYMSQMNPLIGPSLSNGLIWLTGWVWK